MTRRARVLSTVLASLCAVPSVPLVVRAQGAPAEASPSEASPAEPDHAEALTRFREAKRLYGERRFLEAARAFERSLASAWSIEAAYNMALSFDRAEDLLGASAAYRLYLERAAPDDQHRATALERHDQLRRRIGEVRLQIDGLEALRQIKINGVEVARDAFPWFTIPGPLDVEFIGERPGQSKHVSAEVQPGGTVTIVFPGFPRAASSPEVPAQPPSAQPPSPSPRRQKALRAGFWTSAAAAFASGAAVAVFGGLNLYHQGRRNDVSGLCPKPCSDPSLLDGAQRAAEVNATRANVMIPIAAVFAVTAIALGVTILRERPRGAAATRARARWLGAGVELWF